MCVVNLKSVNKLDLTWKQSFLIKCYAECCYSECRYAECRGANKFPFFHKKEKIALKALISSS